MKKTKIEVIINVIPGSGRSYRFGPETKKRIAVKEFIGLLANGRGLYNAWHANISMAFQDEYLNTYKEVAQAVASRDAIKRIADDAATTFLKNLIS